MNRQEILEYLNELKKRKNVRMYTPYKYFDGLTTKRQVLSRFQEILRSQTSDTKDTKSYQPFKTDLTTSEKLKPTKPSIYTKAFRDLYGDDATSLAQKSYVSGVPLTILRKVFNKGKAAWRTGHRVGATETQWGYARVHSFITLGCTVFSSDFSLFEQALETMKPRDRKRWLQMPILCPKSTLTSPFYKKRRTYERFIALKKKYCK